MSVHVSFISRITMKKMASPPRRTLEQRISLMCPITAVTSWQIPGGCLLQVLTWGWGEFRGSAMILNYGGQVRKFEGPDHGRSFIFR
jgi:hypothetical protein